MRIYHSRRRLTNGKATGGRYKLLNKQCFLPLAQGRLIELTTNLPRLLTGARGASIISRYPRIARLAASLRFLSRHYHSMTATAPVPAANTPSTAPPAKKFEAPHPGT